MKLHRAKPADIRAFVEYAVGFTSDVCLRWPFGTNSAGYGHFTVSGRWVLAHRVVCERANGPSQPSQEAAHSCGNGHEGCVNPRHLSWKSRSGNAADMVRQGRSLRGRKHPGSKLTEDAVRFILNNPGLRPCDIGPMFGVSPSAVSQVRRGKAWSWVDREASHAA